ncbi:C-type mannose receptor 2-like [Antedon mediterranea]|uniref:C-type mannose receptor 2-like n=1 Tax=Antedon mediterranea TaxID=105859 RepID=UPI003AF43BA2
MIKSPGHPRFTWLYPYLNVTLLSVLSQQCGQGWKQYGDTCYLIKSDLKWWDEARKNCQNLQADLAIIPSQDVNTFLSGLIKDSNRDFWIGLHDTSNEGNFKWVDGTDLDQSQASWKPGEPNDYNLLGEDCVQIRADTGLWNDENCVTPLPYICSRKQNVEIKCDESNGWSNSNGKCYLFVDEQRSWDRAASECELVGGQLVKVENQNTQDYLNVLTSRYRRTYWIGLSDSNSDTEGDYKWSDDTSLGSYTNWAITEPNNKYFASGGNCAEVLDTVNSVGKWSTAPCSQTLSFICQRPEGICATGWRLFDGNCYQINANSPKTWTDSKHYCEAQGGYLTSILS